MDELLGQSASVSPPVLISPIHEDKAGPSSAVLEDEDTETTDKTENRGKKRGRYREDYFLSLLKEDIAYQREAEERREREARERNERFLSLLEKLVEKKT